MILVVVAMQEEFTFTVYVVQPAHTSNADRRNNHLRTVCTGGVNIACTVLLVLALFIVSGDAIQRIPSHCSSYLLSMSL